MPRRLKALSCAALALGFIIPPAIAEEKSAWRLFVSDHAAPVVRAIDAETGKVLANFATKGPATLHRSESGRTVFAVQGKSDMISVISSGLSMGDHGDHGDLKIEAPSLLEAAFSGAKPSHFVDHHGDIALFFDGEGIVRVISEKDVLAGSKAVREVKTAAPHHGVAVAFGNHVLVTEPNSEKPDELPVGIRVIDSAGAPVGDVHSCPDLHGEASSGNMLAIACAEGCCWSRPATTRPRSNCCPMAKACPKASRPRWSAAGACNIFSAITGRAPWW